MIKGHCFTNLDDYKFVSWPEEFVALPRIDDRVQASSGVMLKVVGITHAMRAIRDDRGGDIIGREPFIKVELNK